MRRLLVTGGAGFIGCNFVHHWLREHPGDRVVVLDALTYAGNAANLESLRDECWPSASCTATSATPISSRSSCDTQGIDTIVHFAAESHVDRSILGPDAFIKTNVVGTHTLLTAARKAWLQAKTPPMPHRFHHVSTDEVYGSLGPDDPAFSETTPYAPNSPYSASKAASDHLVRAYHHTYGLDVTTSNCSNNYGPFHFQPVPVAPPPRVPHHRGPVRPPVAGPGDGGGRWPHPGVRLRLRPAASLAHAVSLTRSATRGIAGHVHHVAVRVGHLERPLPHRAAPGARRGT